MKIMQIAPEERLPNLLQDAERYGYPNLMVNLPRYRCPHCGEYTVFSVPEPNASPIPAGIRAQFDALTDRRSPYEQGVSDFLCRVCAVPVRVVYQINEFQMASYRYFAEAVFETAT
ncbi:hypothetical protein Pan258_59950 [Symmachiella dynata]|uniref:hypothetical protein n=1 Tax=Symmachiella dynata TaxID=2527995 RepID=UPI001189F478|nr:hypothetical protein [Symmachiella dynata]QDT51898.1 hypothetical protein Pan258_59950 [Symmachiella dynata]